MNCTNKYRCNYKIVWFITWQTKKKQCVWYFGLQVCRNPGGGTSVSLDDGISDKDLSKKTWFNIEYNTTLIDQYTYVNAMKFVW